MAVPPEDLSGPSRPRVAAVIVAAGRGSRIGGTVPKQYRHVAGRPILTHTLQRFSASPVIDRIVVVIGAGDRDLFEEAAGGIAKLAPPALGGQTRQTSCRAGLEALVE